MHESHADRRQRVAQEIRRRLVAHVAAGGTTDFAAAPMVNSPAVYCDPARAAVEVRRLFLEMPILVGLSADVAEPGDVLLHEDAGPSVIVTRGQDGKVRAFRNLCTHRGSMLVRADVDGRCERRARFTCPFHAWTFDMEGRLVGLPGRVGFEGVDLEARHLTPVGVAEWHGLVFVQLDGPEGPEGPIDVDAHLGSFAQELAQLELERAARIASSSLSSACNWKLALDTYAEGYHFATLHASTIGASHFSNVAAFDAFGAHWRLNFAEKTLRGLVGTSEDEWPDAEYGGIHFLFPNTVLVVGAVAPGRIFVRMFRLFPGATPETMTCRIAAYGLPGFDVEAYRREAASVPSDAESDVTQEDYRVAEEAQRNFAHAPPGFTLVYGRNEPALQLLHRSIGRVVDE